MVVISKLCQQVGQPLILLVIVVNNVGSLSNVVVNCETSIYGLTVLVSNLDFDRGHATKLLSELLDFRWPCCTKHESLSIRMLDMFHNPFDVFLESHIQHSVGFIQCQIGHSIQISLPTLDEI